MACSSCPIAGPGVTPERYQMAAQHQARGRLMLDAERTGTFEEPVHCGAVERSRAPRAIRLREHRQQLQVHLLCEPPEGAVAHLLAHLVPHAGLQVMRDDAEHLPPNVDTIHAVDVETIEERRGRRHAAFLVPDGTDAAVEEGGGRGLPKVVADGTQHDDDLLGMRQARRCVSGPDRSPSACGSTRLPRDATRVPVRTR